MFAGLFIYKQFPRGSSCFYFNRSVTLSGKLESLTNYTAIVSQQIIAFYNHSLNSPVSSLLLKSSHSLTGKISNPGPNFYSLFRFAKQKPIFGLPATPHNKF